MTIFRHKKNGLLYTIELVTPPRFTGSWYEAQPYNHSTLAYPRKKHADLADFQAVAYS